MPLEGTVDCAVWLTIRSILLDSRADLLVYGNAERAIVDIAHRLAAGEPAHAIRDLRGTAFVCKRIPGDGILPRSLGYRHGLQSVNREHHLVRGWRRVTNDTVNLVSTVAGACVAGAAASGAIALGWTG